MRRPWRFPFLNNKICLLSIDYAEWSGTVLAVTIETTILLKMLYHFTIDLELVRPELATGQIRESTGGVV